MNRTHIKQMLISGKLEVTPLQEFKQTIESRLASNLRTLQLPPHLNTYSKEQYTKCLPLVNQAIQLLIDKNQEEAKVVIQNLVDLLDEGWEYLFQQALIYSSPEQVKQNIDRATQLVNQIKNKENGIENQDFELSWADVIILTHTLQN